MPLRRSFCWDRGAEDESRGVSAVLIRSNCANLRIRRSVYLKTTEELWACATTGFRAKKWSAPTCSSYRRTATASLAWKWHRPCKPALKAELLAFTVSRPAQVQEPTRRKPDSYLSLPVLL